MAKKGFMEWLKGWLMENEEAEEEIKTIIPETKSKPPVVEQAVQNKQTSTVETAINTEKSEEKRETVDKAEAQLENTTSKKEEKTSFLQVEQPVKENKKPEVKTETKTAKEAYRPAQVISPIYGTSQVDGYHVGSSQLETDDDKTVVNSVIGTIFSPMYGKEMVKVTVEDEVDQKIANMTTKDFIVKPEVQQPKPKPAIPTISKVINKKEETNSSKTDTTFKPTEEENYVNLTLFD